MCDSCFQGSPVEYQDIMPAELQTTRKKTAALVNANLGQNATPYTGQLYAPQDPLSSMASSVMMGMMGQAGKTGLYGTPTAGLFPDMNIPQAKLPPGFGDIGGREVDKERKPYKKCPICGATFPDQATLTEHIKLAHPSGTGTYVCPVCGKSFTSQQELIFHLGKHR